MLRPIFTCALTCLMLAGCLGTFQSTTTEHLVNGVEFGAPQLFQLAAPSGAIVLSVAAPDNASVYYHYSVNHTSDVVHPLHLVLIADSVRVDSAENRSFRPSPASGAYAGAGSTEHGTDHEALSLSSGMANVFFTEATTATVVVAWAGLDDDGSLLLQWRPEAVVTPLGTGEASAWRLVDFEGEARAGSQIARVEPASELAMGVPGMDGMLFLRVNRGVATTGTLTILDEGHTRAISMEPETALTATQHAMTTRGDVRVRAEVESAGGDEVYGVYVGFEKQIRLPPFSLEWDVLR